MQNVNLIKNLIFSITAISLLIITPVNAQEIAVKPQEVPVSGISVLNYNNISPVYYDYYNIPALSPALTRVFLILSGISAVLGGFLVAGGIEWTQKKLSRRTARSLIPQLSYSQIQILKPASRQATAEVKFK